MYLTLEELSDIGPHQLLSTYVKQLCQTPVNFMLKCHFLHTKMYSEAVLMFAEHVRVYAVRKQMLRIQIAGNATYLAFPTSMSNFFVFI